MEKMFLKGMATSYATKNSVIYHAVIVIMFASLYESLDQMAN